ncbi:MAG: molecular chaperone TorD [Coriobacteriaceae bacterium]|nr:molecular chaperone TorD [Coriobacteriaceae bacterium]
MNRTAETWADYAEALAFVGNSLLAPMSQTGSVGLDPAFWRSFPDFGDEGVRAAIRACSQYAAEASEADDPQGSVRETSVEYTHLFVGPPHPATPPWETMYRAGSEGSTVGFGKPAFEMRAALRALGLEISNANNQYPDHAGIELLYASVLCGKCADADSQGGHEAELASFAHDRLLEWLPKLAAAVRAEEPEGYYSRLVELAVALVRSL